MDNYVQSMLLGKDGVIEQIDRNDKLIGGKLQQIFPCVDSPNWGKYHTTDVALALIKMRPLIPIFGDLCRLPNWLEGIEGDDDFEIEKIKGGHEVIGCRNIDINQKND